MSKYSQFFAIIKKLDLTKEEVILEFTNGKTNSLSSLNDSQYNELLRRLQPYNGIPPGDETRKKMIAIAKTMNWGRNNKEILSALDTWCVKQKFKKRFMSLTPAELSVLVSIFENKVQPDYLSALNT